MFQFLGDLLHHFLSFVLSAWTATDPLPVISPSSSTCETLSTDPPSPLTAYSSTWLNGSPASIEEFAAQYKGWLDTISAATPLLPEGFFDETVDAATRAKLEDDYATACETATHQLYEDFQEWLKNHETQHVAWSQSWNYPDDIDEIL
ncbi:hypothetical protein B0H13DRAFT_2106789 [Mycena leptocephala]|nr:hypothetical protein B0H13DRAFT_2106789 [Mycena leptocephala]